MADLGITVSMTLAMSFAATMQSSTDPWRNPSLSADARAQAAVEQMTQAEKLSLVFGFATGEQATRGFTPPAEAYPGSAGYIPGVPRLGLPPLWETDSGIGVSGVGPAAEARQRTALPSILAVAATWNPELAERGGAMIGGEARSSGFNVMLGGSSVLAREPRSGRNFENAGEDPWLNGVMTGAVVKGIQSAHVISTIKHFSVNAQETGRGVVDARIDEDQARVSDYLATQIALERSQPGSVMCAYNKVNGVHSCENGDLLTTMLKQDWGYRGFVMSDWGAVHSTEASAVNGLDQQSGWPFDKAAYFGAPLQQAIAEGRVEPARLDDMVRRITRAMYASGIVDDPVQPSGAIDFDDHARVSQAIAEQAIVLLKNDHARLPLAPGLSLAVIGGHADKGVLSGGGSAQVHPPGGNAVPGLEPTGWPGPVVYIPSAPLDAFRRRDGSVAFASGTDIAEAVALARRSDVAVVFVTQWTTESRDASLTLPDAQDALVSAVAAANPNTVVVVESGGAVLMPWADAVPAILQAWYPGAAGGEAIARVAFGEVDATGRLPISIPRSVDQLVRPELDGAGLAEDEAFLVRYSEGAAVGYKWHARQRTTPQFPFGHGLSYTDFALSDLKVVTEDGVLKAQVSVRNVGRRDGSETVQLYADPVAGGWEAPRRLVAFGKVEIPRGETRTLSLAVDPRLLATWDTAGRRWIVAGGGYQVSAGTSSAALPLTATTRVESAVLPAIYRSPEFPLQ